MKLVRTIAEIVTTGAVPEPMSWAMMILGAGMIGYAMRRRPGERVGVLFG